MRTMWRNTLTLFLAIQSMHTVQALSLAKRDTAAVLALDVSRNHVSDPVARDMRRKRSLTVSQALNNEETLYFCNITLGTPAQSLRLTLDTGSSDLWVNAPNSTSCSGRVDQCTSSGTYNTSSSSSYRHVSSDFNISYVDGTGAAGDYVTDTLTIGGVTIPAFQFGVGYSSSSNVGVLGIGYTADEVQVNRDQKAAYANLPLALVNHGLINSNAYSLWLNDLNANTGSILFGGVDSGKYTGELETLPIQKIDGEYAELLIIMTGVALQNSSGGQSYSSQELPATVLLDSGSSLTYLPETIVEDLYNDLGVVYEASTQTGYVPCSMMSENINITYTFTSPSIPVGISELVLDNGSGLTFNDGTPACVFGIAPASDSTAVLGDTFLRSTYVVYDLSKNEISLAPTRFNSTDENILEITNGTRAVPGATSVANPVTTVATGVGAAWTVSPALITSTSSSGVARSMASDIPRHLGLGAAGAGILLAL
ncbi:aspartic-type endopeptidase (OpsB), putative [Talaromyces stipitatus ATCC 10500]|uniref:Probable aspartic-type endopeptidase OPSB n=1 Tax=Talaromyces stipitatus (strain ATCC 10500 / CBS 375.48 / QM 6759 / NRRL 1006) TaxID=441959 RepID=B8MTR9_TALSN|nr:aspartic-type endopeptidase (OpsB), putative [Talaromyces stipitatus ATCC 10500]EED12554.1 aspartic-type endopeptidase (OpsB), putative [Talaromyces stipitatus ATCC 10500]